MKKVFITGASEGLGRCFAHKFAKEGYRVTAVARNEERLKSLMQELNGEHSYIVADLGKQEGQNTCAERLSQEHFNVCINNAGFSRFGDFRDSDIELELKVLQVNLEAILRLSHAFLNKAQAGDSLINLSSLTYYLPTPIQASYVASKCWIGSFSESLWYQGRAKGVYVQGLCPGITKTEFMNRAADDINHKALLDLISGTSESVVDASYKAMLKRKGPIVVPGFLNQLLAWTMRLLPRRISVYLLGKVGSLA